jgi:hypothetical protein
MGSDDIADVPPGISKQIAALLPQGDLADVPEEDLIAALIKMVSLRADLQVTIGQLAAELYRRPERHSWQAIADMVGMSKATVYRYAKPYVNPKPKTGKKTR